MSKADVDRFLSAFEPAAVEAFGGDEVPLASFAALSAAISQKRIADALWGVPNETDGLLQLLNPLQVRNNY